MTEKPFDKYEYDQRYLKEKYKHYHLAVPNSNEPVIRKLNEVPNRNRYIIELIEKDLKGE